ncbi:MAG: thioredoxin family protein [Gaiella sp.]
MPVRTSAPEQDASLPTLIFVRDETSGPSRRMESLVAWIRVTQKKRLRVVDLEASINPVAVERLGVTVVPSLVLIDDGEVAGRLEGRVGGKEIEALISRAL